MPLAPAVPADDVAVFMNVPPPPYPGHAHPGTFDLTPTPQSLNRPRLPVDRRNPFLSHLPEDVTIVKFQTIVRENKEIVVGRIKVPTPGETPHAFILRRYDTNAISLTTMFKVAFPGAADQDERREIEWVRSSYDTSGTNGPENDQVRLAGQWVSRHLAIHLSDAYGLSVLVQALARAVPDPNVIYRKSNRSIAATAELARRAAAENAARRPAPSMSIETASPASKRRRGSEPPETRPLAVEATTTITAPAGANIDMEREIELAKQLVLDVRRELQLRNQQGQELEDTGVTGESSRGIKRGQDDGGIEMAGGAVRGERIIKKNKRVEGSAGAVRGAAKQAAIGAVLFGLGAGVMAYLPQITELATSFF
ncbi:hypothetical protein Q5752_001670 [Cryptotrichosporon argae]